MKCIESLAEIERGDGGVEAFVSRFDEVIRKSSQAGGRGVELPETVLIW